MGGIFSKPKVPPPPPIPKPAPMPDPEDKRLKTLKKKEAAMRQQTGREATTALGDEEIGL